MLSDQNIYQELDSFIRHISGYSIIKDLQSKYLKISEKMAELIGLPGRFDGFGLTDYTVNHEIVKYADMFVAQDKELISSGSNISGFYSIEFNGMIRPLFFNKYFIKNHHGENVAIVAQTIDLTSSNLSNGILDLINNNQKIYADENLYLTNRSYTDIDLSIRQSQCLFYLLKGYTNKEIARLLSLSPRTIEHYVDTIKDKMKCRNKGELIAKAIDKGYLSIIPPGIQHL